MKFIPSLLVLMVNIKQILTNLSFFILDISEIKREQRIRQDIRGVLQYNSPFVDVQRQRKDVQSEQGSPQGIDPDPWLGADTSSIILAEVQNKWILCEWEQLLESIQWQNGSRDVGR